MQIKVKHRPNFKYPLLSFAFLPGLFFLMSCASSEVQKEVQKRVGLEKKVAFLEQKILDQKKELMSLKGNVATKNDWSVLHLEAKVKELEGATEKSMALPPVTAFVSPHEDTVADSSDEAMHLYYEGTQELKEKKYDSAVKSFNDFLSENPDHVYADRAQFMILEAHLENREYGLALVASNVLENRYPHSLKLPNALFKRALCFLGLEQKAKGIQALKTVLSNYPQSSVAPIASERLATLTEDRRMP
ncbi:MAG: outer membrane protein assembly factor BamD [Proteobacteria bacterium]|nr:outer membrane protein assembly factor BamD [Pseudomonadota bacterium]NDC24227.1 outer membrane protein assembly factor BamD [Pseudomonadota bacterium]NDD04238.1 outer membrane protein assembly factor BamD [Pseudomonadota bacterium]NDG26800.1 outer membrane protein assembly factor BamD [Pseudomonadota bacterium]